MAAEIDSRLTDDLEHILLYTKDLWNQLRNKTVFVTGGTGFFGKWIIESFIYINRKLDLQARMIVLTRNKDAFFQHHRYITQQELSFAEGDVKNFAFPESAVHFIIHAATEASASLNASQPLVMLDTITQGTRRVLDLAVEKKVEGFLFTSSGAVYGKQPEHITHIKETESFYIDISNPASAYAEGKRLAELYCAVYAKHDHVPVKIARCFAFVGPYLPLHTHFAIGNFISNALNNEDIIIKGDGSPFRSYLYAADLAIWLWTILFKGRVNIPYNVGSDEDYNLKDVAASVQSTNTNITVQVKGVAKPGIPVERYIPDIQLAKSELGLQVCFPLIESIIKTKNFYAQL